MWSTPDTYFQREGKTKALRLLEERDLGLKMTFSGVVLCQNQGPGYSKNYNLVTMRVRRLLVRRDFGLKMLFLVAKSCQNQGGGYRYSWLLIFITNWRQQECVGYSWFAFFGSGWLRILIMKWYFGLKMTFSVAKSCQNQGTGYQWFVIFMANWRQQECIGYSWFENFRSGWARILIVKCVFADF